MAPLCAKIAEQEACDKTCTYAFNEPELQPLIPTSLVIDICRGEEGQYTELCPRDCPEPQCTVEQAKINARNHRCPMARCASQDPCPTGQERRHFDELADGASMDNCCLKLCNFR